MSSAALTTTTSEGVTLNEFIQSLTGYDEQAIEDQFGGQVIRLLAVNPTKAGRALVFIDRRRQGLDDAAAKHAAMEMRLAEVDAYFADDDEIDADEPETPAGEGDSTSG